LRVCDAVAVRANLDDVAFLQVGHVLGDLQQRRGVGCEEVFPDAGAVHADTQQQRRTAPRPHHQLRLATADHGQRIGAFELVHRAGDRFEQVQSAAHQGMNQVGDDLGVGL
jgi:hypothetical protein